MSSNSQPCKVFILSAHFRTNEWVQPQRAFLNHFADVAHQRIFAVNGVDESEFDDTEETISYAGDHGEALDLLARHALQTAFDHDWLVFLDSDAFPVLPLSKVLASGSDFIAVQRLEHLGSEHPHPCFTAVRVETYRVLGSSWRNGGYHWVDESGRNVSDVGSGFIPSLEKNHIAWLPLRKIASRELHPVFFALYGTQELGPVVYHHGAGSKRKHTAIEVFWETRRPIYSALKNLEYRLNAFVSPRLWRIGITPISIWFTRPRKAAGAALLRELKTDHNFWHALYPSKKNRFSRAVRRWCRLKSIPLAGPMRF